MLDVIDARLTCPRCGLYFNERSFHSACSNCGALLDLDVQTDAKPAELRRVFGERLTAMTGIDRSGVWRYREIVMPTVGPGEIVSYPEGNTPLIESAAVASYAGGSLSLKHEGMNPTGSFKDRGMTVAITQARRLGASAVACASTGNTSASLAAYAAMAGLPGLVLIPAGKIATGKLAQTLAHGARTIAVRLAPTAVSPANGTMAIGVRCAPAPVISIDNWAPAGTASRTKITPRRKRIFLFVQGTEGKF